MCVAVDDFSHGRAPPNKKITFIVEMTNMVVNKPLNKEVNIKTAAGLARRAEGFCTIQEWKK